jgi:hypothetical protein
MLDARFGYSDLSIGNLESMVTFSNYAVCITTPARYVRNAAMSYLDVVL